MKVLMFPWLAYGHISPHVELAKKLADRGFSIHLCSTPVNLGFIENKITDRYAASIHVVELHLPEAPGLPPHHHTTNGLPPHLKSALKSALFRAKPELATILSSLKPDLVIYDALLTWTGTLTAELSIPGVRFSTVSAVVLAYSCQMMLNPDQKFPFPAIYLSEHDHARTSVANESSTADIEEEDPAAERPNRFCDQVLLVKSSKEIEEKYMDYVSREWGAKIAGVGPLFQEPGNGEIPVELMEWLGTKTANSCVFVSFGSEYFLTKEEMEEVAFGLELSGVNFIWVVRFPEGDRAEDSGLPAGFLSRVGERGRIVEKWAPQAEILAHSSVGGFVSHCGWSSVVESVMLGVPIIAVPMHLDQPLNARLMVELGVATEVPRDGSGRLERSVIAKVVRDVVVEEDSGEIARRNMADARERIKARENEELDQVVELLKQICTQQSG